MVSKALCLSSGGGMLAAISWVNNDISVCSRDSVTFNPGDLRRPVYGLNLFFFSLSSSYKIYSHTLQVLSIGTDRAEQTVQIDLERAVWSGSTLSAIPSATFNCITKTHYIYTAVTEIYSSFSPSILKYLSLFYIERFYLYLPVSVIIFLFPQLNSQLSFSLYTGISEI